MELVRRDNRSNNVNRMLIPIPPSDYISKFSQKPPVSRWVGFGPSVRPSVSQSVSQMKVRLSEESAVYDI